MKSYIGIGVRTCPVCSKESEQVLLIDRRLQDSVEAMQHIGYALCKEHQKDFEEGKRFLIEVANEAHSLEQANRTGRYMVLNQDSEVLKAFKVPVNAPIPLS